MTDGVREPVMVVLEPEQLAELARLVADELRGEPAKPSGLVDAKTLAGLLGVSRDFVYEHADELGAEPLSSGVRPRKRFDVAKARAAIESRAGPAPPRKTPPRTPPRRRRQRAVASPHNASGAASRERPAPGPQED